MNAAGGRMGLRVESRGTRRGRGRTAATVSLGVLLVAAGCSLAFKRPTVRVAEIRVASMNLRGGTLAVTLDIDNPNDFALESQDFSYRLAFFDGPVPDSTNALTDPDAWVQLAEGRVAEPVKVPAHRTGSVRVNVPFDLGTVGLAAGRLLRQGQLEYRFTGELRVHTPLGSKRLPFDERGSFRP